MPRNSLRPRSRRFTDVAAVASITILDFLVPSLANQQRRGSAGEKRRPREIGVLPETQSDVERCFFAAITRATSCSKHQRHFHAPESNNGIAHAARTRPSKSSKSTYKHDVLSVFQTNQRRSFSTTRARSQEPDKRQHEIDPYQFKEHAERFRKNPDSKVRRVSSKSRLSQDFFDDVSKVQKNENDVLSGAAIFRGRSGSGGVGTQQESEASSLTSEDLNAQLRLLQTVRELEEKLAGAKAQLEASMRKASETAKSTERPGIQLTKEDYKGLVDLYYYSARDRYHPGGPDFSPSPTFLDSYSPETHQGFKFDRPEHVAEDDVQDDTADSQLKEVEATLHQNKRREIAAMQHFIDLLLDETSSNRDLFIAYKRFPHPGVSWLPAGVIRLFLQRMSTPLVKSPIAMVKYLSLIDDMQAAKLPITVAEWSSAIYLAGRSLGKKVTSAEVNNALEIWRKMERDAGVQSTHVTFNILFDIAVRAGKYAMAENFMQEMFSRGLRLNRLGRVSLIYYHGIRGDGDAVRRTYRDFVDAGEIVDTLVLNCVIVSLFNASEPAAAEQVYERMRDLQKRLVRGTRPDGSETFYIRYPESSSNLIDREAASNSLGRVLLSASKLKDVMPDKHAELQDSMPLRPDHFTFRAMIAYYANESGDLDRITVLIKQMTEEFDLPMSTKIYHLLFKGFALHGQMKDSEGMWRAERLRAMWDLYLQALKDAKFARRAVQKAASAVDTEEEELPTLPSFHEIEGQTTISTETPQLHGQKRLDAVDEFVIDLAIYPQERRKPIERIHAQLFDEEKPESSGFLSPFFPKKSASPPSRQEMIYALGNEEIDHEEGEYVLPPQATVAVPSSLLRSDQSLPRAQTRHNAQDADDDLTEGADHPNQKFSSERASLPDDQSYASARRTADELRHNTYREDDEQERLGSLTPSPSMVCWVLRAYAQCTGSRPEVVEVYNRIRKIYRPRDQIQAQSIVRVLQRCLRNCDRYKDYMI